MLDNRPAPAHPQREPGGRPLPLDGASALPRLLRGSPDVLVVLDPDGRVQSTSPAAANVLGHPPEALVGRPLSAVAHPDDADDLEESLERVAGGDTLHDHAHRFGDDGRWVDWTAWPHDGHVVLLGRSAQLRHDALEAHYRTESRYRHLLDALQEGVWFLDPDLRTTYASPGLAALLGRTPDQMNGASLERFLDEATALRLRGLQGQGRSRLVLEVGLPSHRPSSRFVRTGLLCASAVDDPDGRDGFLVTIADVTEQRLARVEMDRIHRRLERQVARRTEALEAAKHDMEVVGLAISHDVRGPVRTATTLLEWALQEADLPPQVAEALRHAERDLRGADRLVGGLLRLGQVGHRTLRPAPVDVDALAADVIASLRKRPEADGVTFEVPPLPPCHADPDLVRDVLLNLLGNACKYGRPGGTVLLAGEVDPASGGDFVEYVVRDDGPGFDAEQANRLFDLFERGASSTGGATDAGPDDAPRPADGRDERTADGHGIGLAVVRRIVERHGGTVRAVPRPGDGGEFRFRLPGGARDAL